MNLANVIILWIHLLSAILFVGGSLFIWLIVVPVSRGLVADEKERTELVAKIAKRFGKLVNPTFGILLVTGIYNATWYLPSLDALFTTFLGQVLLIKSILAAVLVFLVYFNNIVYARRIVNLARQGRMQELEEVRKTSRLISFANLALMIAIVFLAVVLRNPP